MIISQDNRRDYIRMLINATCDVNVLATNETLTAICTDMSATGIALSTQVPLNIGAEVEVFIESQNANFASLQAKATAVRCEQKADGEYIIGLQVISFNQ